MWTCVATWNVAVMNGTVRGRPGLSPYLRRVGYVWTSRRRSVAWRATTNGQSVVEGRAGRVSRRQSATVPLAPRHVRAVVVYSNVTLAVLRTSPWVLGGRGSGGWVVSSELVIAHAEASNVPLQWVMGVGDRTVGVHSRPQSTARRAYGVNLAIVLHRKGLFDFVYCERGRGTGVSSFSACLSFGRVARAWTCKVGESSRGLPCQHLR